MPSISDRSEATYQAFRKAIAEHRLRPGTKLPEDEIARLFGASRTIARSVLLRLQSNGLVHKIGNRTATVAELDEDEAQETFGMLRALGGETVKALANRWQADFDDRLQHHVGQEEAAITAGDTRGANRLAGEFHVLLASLSGNMLIKRYVSELILRCSLVLANHNLNLFDLRSVREHSGIIASLRAADEKRSRMLVDAHWTSIEHRALSGFQNRPAASLAAILADQKLKHVARRSVNLELG